MFFFAYDGSISGDWVSHYAIQLAAAHHDRVLTLIHVRDGRIPETVLAEKLRRMRLECERHGVGLEIQRVPLLGGGRVAAIRSAVPRGPEHFLLCGTPARERRGGFLEGTAAGQLLGSGHCNVLVVRVVQPGLLGVPRRLLLPVAEHPEGFRSGLPFLRLFGPQVSHLHIVLVAPAAPRHFSRLSPGIAESARASGQVYCERVEREIVDQLGLGAKVMDAQILVSDQIPHEILIAANRTKSRLIYMGASRRTPAERLFRGNPVDRILRDSNCDVAIYRGIDE